MKAVKFIALLLCLTGFFTSCSSDKDNSEEIKGKERVAWIKSQVLDGSGKVIFRPTNDDGVYVFGVENREIAHSLCQSVIQTEFLQGDYTYNLPNKLGTIKFHLEDNEGFYYTVEFAISTMESFVVKFMHPQAIEDHNMVRPDKSGYPYYVCQQCKKVYLTRPHECQKCRNISFDEKGWV